MSIELSVLAWGCVLALVHVFAAVRAKTRQYGLAWNMGARDATDLPPLNPVAGRLARAQANFFETFPLMAAAILIVTLASLEDKGTAIGAILWLACRVLYLPLYALAVPYARSAAWIGALVGVVLVLWPALRTSVAVFL